MSRRLYGACSPTYWPAPVPAFFFVGVRWRHVPSLCREPFWRENFVATSIENIHLI